MSETELLKIANEALRKRLLGMASDLATVQSDLGDARVRIEELQSAVRQHYVATFGHSACFERDEKLWAVIRDGVVRKWVRASLPAKEEHEQGCRQYRESLFPDGSPTDEPT